ncbi:MAG: site-2 protease family protein [Capsulimonadales bacterium]|nr:site-2 protease family protein [Capsulimonadales bacterium]
MTCLACERQNLPGGIRCAYCGAYLPQALEFDLGETAGTPPAAKGTPIAEPVPLTGSGQAMVKAVGWITPIVLVATKLKSILALLKLQKIATTLISMFVFIWADALLFGWKFGAGIAISIFIHEMGHVYVNWRYKLPQSAPVFIPFLGAAIFLKNFPDNPQIQSESGAGGPIAGFLAAIGCYLIYLGTKDPFWLALAHTGFAINLFNLIPFPPLDGSHIQTVFSPGLRNLVLILMLLWVIKIPAGILWVILIGSVLVRFSQPESDRYRLARPAVRARMAAIYLAMCLPMSWAAEQTTVSRTRASAPPVTVAAPQERGTAGTPDRPPEDLQRIVKEAERRRQIDYGRRWKQSRLFLPVNLAAAMVGIGLWTASVGLLLARRRRGWTPADGRFVLGMAALFPLTCAGAYVVARPLAEQWQILGAYLLGTAGAFAYTVYLRVLGRDAGETMGALRTRLLGVFAFGVFLMGYGANHPGILAVCALGIVIFFALHRWQVPATLGRIAERSEDTAKAIKEYERAVTACPDVEEQAVLRTKIARLNLQLYRGSAALAAFEKIDRSPQQEERAGMARLGENYEKAQAYGLTDRFEEGLALCERSLHEAAADPVRSAALVPVALAYTHLTLAHYALLRGWHDEAIVQIDWCLGALSASSVTLRATLHLFKAEALAAQAAEGGETERHERLLRAEEECRLGAERNHGAIGQAHVATVRAQIARGRKDEPTAQSEAKKALRLAPEHLACRYWYGRLVDGEASRSLAVEFPEDHFGRLAVKENAPAA